MNLVFISDTLAPNRNEDADLLPYNSYYSEVFFEYTRLNNDWIRDKLWDDVNITEELPKTEKYVIVWDTFDSAATMEKMISRNTSVSKKILSDLKHNHIEIYHLNQIFFQYPVTTFSSKNLYIIFLRKSNSTHITIHYWFTFYIQTCI